MCPPPPEIAMPCCEKEGNMATCDACGSIMFGGVRDGERRYCNEECRQRGAYVALADQMPEQILDSYVKQTHEGDCPKCQGPGPVDVHISHSVWSALIITHWGSHPEVCCQSCGTKAKLVNSLFSLALGWWGFPWGLIATPIQIARNLGGLFSTPDPTTPSPKLREVVKLHLAASAVESYRDQQPADGRTKESRRF